MKRREFVTALGLGTAGAALVGCNQSTKDCDVTTTGAEKKSEGFLL